jgi:Formin Homology 2 Domain
MKIAAAVFANDDTLVDEEPPAPESTKASTTGPHLSAEEEAIAEMYRKMLKLRIPADGVRHKMTKDEVNPKIIAAVLGDEPAAPEEISKETLAVGTKKKGAVLSDEDESVASQYRKLLKLQVSKEAVLARMQKENISEKIITTVLGGSALASKPSEESKSSGSVSTGSNLINLHWNAMEDVPAGSVWETSKHASEPERSDITKLVELFQKKKPSAIQKERRKDDELSNGAGKAKLLDLTRSNNIAISLKAFKEFSHTELAEIIGFLDPTRKIRGERAQFIRDLLPTMTEIKIIEEFSGSDDRLVPAELWFRHLRGIKRLERKAHVLRTMEMFTAEAAEVRGNFRLLTQVCRQVMASVKLQDLLGMVLRIGNVMNEGTRTGGAAGFRFDSLLRLTQTKTSDGKITVLDYLVTVFVAKGERDTLDLASDLPDCHKASRLLISDMTNEVKLLQESLEQCKSELEDLEQDQAPRIPKSAKPSGSGGGDSRAQLFASILARGGSNSETHGAPLAPPRPTGISDVFAKRDQFLAAIKDTKKDDKLPANELIVSATSPDFADDSKILQVSSPKIENTLSGGMKRLRSFIETVEESFSRLEKQRDEALEACKDLSRYCGESGGIGATTLLLNILAQFAKNVEDALKKHDEQQQNDARKQKAQEARDIRSTASNDVVQFAEKKDGRSLVLLVNDILKNANPRFKEDFKSGRVLPNPSDSLKAIYEREQKAAAAGDRKLDIVSVIRERESSMHSEEIHQARSRFAGVHHLSNDAGCGGLNCDPATLSVKESESLRGSTTPSFNTDESSKRKVSAHQQPEKKISVKERALLLRLTAQQHSLKELTPLSTISAAKPEIQTTEESQQETSEMLAYGSSGNKIDTQLHAESSGVLSERKDTSARLNPSSTVLIHRLPVVSNTELRVESQPGAEQSMTATQCSITVTTLVAPTSTISENEPSELNEIQLEGTSANGELKKPCIPAETESKHCANDAVFTPEQGKATASRVLASTHASTFDLRSSQERVRSRIWLSPPKSTGSLSEVMKALEQISKEATKPGPKRVSMSCATRPLPLKPPSCSSMIETKEKKSLADRAREKRMEKSLGSLSSPQKRGQSSSASSLLSTPPVKSSTRRATIDTTPDAAASTTNESSTARLARKKRIQKRMSR